METAILEYLAKQPTGCLAVQLGSGPHTATLHFSSVSEPLRLFFQTDKDSKKCQGLANADSAPASFTTGFSDTEWLTLQMDGSVRYARADEMEIFEATHYAKHPEAKKYADEDTAYLIFEPNWWRYSDYTQRPPRIIES